MAGCHPVPPVVPDPPLRQGYNSHGGWSTLAEIREVELERGNEFPDLTGCPDDTPAIWLARDPRTALRYSVGVGEWDRIDSGGKLTDWEREEVEAIRQRPIRVLPGDIIAVDDGDGGYLLLRPGKGHIGRDTLPRPRMSACITTGRHAGYCPPTGADRDFGELRALLDEYLFFAVALDGIVVDPATANDRTYPCRCVEITKSSGEREPFCFKRGVIGTLTQEQVRELCATSIPLRNPEGIERRVAAFQRASEECVGVPIEERLACMSAALHRNGQAWGEANAR